MGANLRKIREAIPGAQGSACGCASSRWSPAAIRERKLYRKAFQTFEAYCEARWEWTRERGRQLIEAGSAAQKMATIVGILPTRESHVRPLLRIEDDGERAAVWQQITIEHPDGRITAKDVESVVARFEAAKSKNWLTLDEWNALSENDRALAVAMIRPEPAKGGTLSVYML